jgi:antitoxin component YwqK of YwqJK toxin-antitoxin module
VINPTYLSLLLFVCLPGIGLTQSDTLNRIDTNGLRQDYWIVYGKDVPEKGYPPDGKVEEGAYLDNKKTGAWKMYHTDGSTIRTTAIFTNGRPEGMYHKYDPGGTLIETGCYKNGKQIGEFRAYHPSGCLAMQKFYNAEGKEEGPGVIYYDKCDTTNPVDPIGQVQIRYQKINGVLAGESTWYYQSGCKMAIDQYNSAGELTDRQNFNDDCRDSLLTGSEKFYPIYVPWPPEPPQTTPDGYHTLYNSCKSVAMQGQFKGGKLWEGKLFKYDSDCIVIKVEIWKEGKYYADGEF